MRQRFYFLTVISLCLSLTITGCSLQDLLGNKKKSTSQNSQTSQKQSIMVVSLNEDDPNQVLIKRGLEDMASKGNMQIKYLTPEGKEAGGKQKSNNKSDSQSVGTEALQGAKVLVFQGGNPGVVQTAQAKKIPVLAIGQVPTGSKPSGLIIPDQEKVGELMGQALVSKLQDGNVVILQADPSESGAQERLAGIRSVLGKYPKLSMQTILGQPGSELAKQKFTEFVQKNPAKVQGVLADTEKTAVQAVEVLKQAQMDKKVILIGGQANTQSLQRMANGGQTGDVDISPYLQGVNAYQWAQKLSKNESLDVTDSVTSDQGEIPAKVIPVKAVTAENLAITQKSYEKAMALAAEEKKKQEEKTSEQNNKESKDKNSSGQNSSNSKEGNSQDGKQGASGGSESGTKIPAGVNKVTEHIKTEIIREYLDAQGKVIGTERNANEQVRTVPPEMLKQEQEQATQKTEQKTSSKDKEKDTGK